jgi:hypothetical protein
VAAEFDWTDKKKKKKRRERERDKSCELTGKKLKNEKVNMKIFHLSLKWDSLFLSS